MNAAQKLIREHNLTWEEFAELIKMADDPQVDALLAEEAVRIRKEVYGTDVYIRGLTRCLRPRSDRIYQLL